MSSQQQKNQARNQARNQAQNQARNQARPRTQQHVHSTPAGVLTLRPVAYAVAIAICSAAFYVATPTVAHAQSASAVRAEAAVQTYRIPAGSLSHALRSLASSANMLLTFTADQTEGKTSAGINGQYTAQAALTAVLAGTGLQAVQLDNGGFVLRKAPANTSNTNGSKAAADVLPTLTVQANAESASDLPAAYAGGQVARGARVGLLGNLDMMDMPFNVTAYTAQTMADQQSATVGEVLRNDPSVRFTTSDGHNAENFKIRGFDVNSYELAFNGMYGMLPGTHVPTEFLERVEVFKGPAAMLSGISPSGAVGGVINLVPKRAADEALTRVTASYTSESRFGVAADVGRRFGEEKRLGIRFNGSVSDGETSLEDQKKRERFAALGIDYRGDGWKLELDAYSATQNQSNGSPLMVDMGTFGRVLPAPDPRKNSLRGTFATQDSQGIALRGEVDIAKGWTAYASLGSASYNYDGYLNGTRIVVTTENGQARGQTYNQGGYTDSVSVETGLRGAFSTGAVTHQMVMSMSSLQTKSGMGNVARSANFMTNLYNPIANPALAGEHGAIVKTADNRFTSFSIADTLGMLDGRLQLTLGARAQRVRQTMATPKAYDEQAITPMLGVVVKPWGPSVSLYANYIEALSAGTTVGTTYANAGEVLSPYKTKQKELGVKWDAGTFTNTISLFNIEMPSMISVTGIGAGALPTLALSGKQRNNGLEWNTFGQITKDVRVLGGVAFTEAKQVRANSPATNGNDVAGVPRWTANLGAEWDTPWARGLTLNARMTYTGTQYLDAVNKLELSSWQRWDIGARYATHIAGKAVTVRASVENLADRRYWSGYFNDGFATLGSPRTFKLSTSVDF